MKNFNIGVANFIISNKLMDSYFNNSLINESKKLTADFFNLIEESPILQLEFKVFNNLESKFIENDLAATRYIDTNIKLFETFTADEIREAHKKLSGFINENIELNENKANLYEAISTLIIESVNDCENIDVDGIHESFITVLNHVKSPKLIAEKSKHSEYISEDVIGIAVDKFNKKYETLNEDDKTLIKTLIKSSVKEKKILLEQYKTETLALLENVSDVSVQNEINKTKNKIQEMKYDAKTIDDNILSLHELKSEISNI